MDGRRGLEERERVRGEEERERDGKRYSSRELARDVPCSCSWVCGDVTPKGDEDDEGEVE